MAKTVLIGAGNLDLENDPLAIKQGDYRSALDVTPISDGNGNTVSYEPVLGNELSFDLGFQPTQKKILKIQLATGTGTYSISFHRYNYILIGTATFAQDIDAATTVSNAAAAILSNVTDSVIISTDPSTISLTISIDSVGYGLLWDWYTLNASLATVAAIFDEIQEAIDSGCAGVFSPIGSNDLLGDEFIWSATVGEKPKTLPITSVGTDSTGFLVVLEVANHGLSGGECIYISGVTGISGLNMTGEWIAYPFIDSIGYTDANRITIYGSFYDTPYTLTNANITVNYKSVGQITVSQEDTFNNTTNSWSLIRSKKLNFRSQAQVDTYVENDQRKKSLYFTDNFNPIRVMYYYGQYMDNGFLSFTSSVGAYSYLTIYDESKLLISDSNLTVEYTGTSEGIGELKSGDYRYSVSLETDNGSVSEWTPLTNIINIYSALSSGSPFKLMGDADGTVTNKANNISISGIPNGLFKYINLAYVIYQGIGNISQFVSKTVITGGAMTLTHTGYESALDIDLGQLNTANSNYQTAESIDVLNNKMIISNLTTNSVIDFSSFFSQLTHSITRELISSVGETNTVAFDNYHYGENYNPLNTYNKKSFIHNETYRFGARVKLKGGALLPNIFWIDDIRIDTSGVNVTTPNRRIAGLPDFQLVDYGGTRDVYVTKVNFSNIDWNSQIGGVRLIDLVERIYIYQVEMTEEYKEVLGTGLSILYLAGSQPGYSVTHSSGIVDLSPAFYSADNGDPNHYGEWNAFSDNSQLVGFTTDYTGFGSNTFGKLCASFYSPDEYYGNQNIAYQQGDKLLVEDYQQSTPIDSNQGHQGLGANAWYGRYMEIYGGDGSAFTSCVLDDVKYISRGGSHSFDGVHTMTKVNTLSWTDSSSNIYLSHWQAPASPVCYCSAGFPLNGGGHHYAQYFRDKNNFSKFGDKNDSKYIPTGAYIDAPIIASVTNIDAYGDSFTQSSIFKLRYPEYSDTQYTGGGAFAKNGWGFGVTFYSQNRVNSQMRYAANGNPLTVAPMDFGGDNWLNSSTDDSSNTKYTASYTFRNGVNILPAYNSNAIDNTLFPTRIAYSQTKPNGSVTDEYRIFKPLDFRDLDMVNGRIVHHEICNSELLTWQQRSFQRQYFNSNGLLANANGTEVILGDGAALSRRGVQLSSIGTKHKWSIVKGVSKGGNDVIAWINTEYGYIIRFGYDGVNPISVVHNINGFIDKNTKWVDNKFTPAYDEGISGVWNDERKEYIFTVRARKSNMGLYNPNQYYSAGDMVYMYGANQVPDIYIALQDTRQYNGNTVSVWPITDGNYWRKEDDPKLRNEYTLCFNELKAGFVCNYSFIPKFYAKWKKGYLSSNPFYNGNMFLHNRGTYSFWYQQLRSNPFIELVLNTDPFLKKSFNAVELNSQDKPNDSGYAMEFFTEQHYSYLRIEDFNSDELHDILYSSWIKNDATISQGNLTGLNDIDTSSLFGEYLLAKYFFKGGVYNKLFGVAINWQPRSRLNNS